MCATPPPACVRACTPIACACLPANHLPACLPACRPLRNLELVARIKTQLTLKRSIKVGVFRGLGSQGRVQAGAHAHTTLVHMAAPPGPLHCVWGAFWRVAGWLAFGGNEARGPAGRLTVRAPSCMPADRSIDPPTDRPIAQRMLVQMAAEARTNLSLLASILPSNVITQLKQGATLIAQFHERVTILFSVSACPCMHACMYAGNACEWGICMRPCTSGRCMHARGRTSVHARTHVGHVCPHSRPPQAV